MGSNLNSLFVFSSVGSNLNNQKDIFDSWNIDQYDTGCVNYGIDNDIYHKYFNIVENNIGFKFPNFLFLNKKYDLINRYKYIAIIDDDLFFNQSNSFQQILLLMNKYHLSICSLSNDIRYKYTNSEVMHSNNKNELWITNFCEMGFMVISSHLLKIVIKYYLTNQLQIVDWGWDWLICNIANNTNHRIGIIKNLSFTNPLKKSRNFGYREWFNDRYKVTKIAPITKEIISLC